VPLRTLPQHLEIELGQQGRMVQRKELLRRDETKCFGVVDVVVGMVVGMVALGEVVVIIAAVVVGVVGVVAVVGGGEGDVAGVVVGDKEQRESGLLGFVGGEQSWDLACY